MIKHFAVLMFLTASPAWAGSKLWIVDSSFCPDADFQAVQPAIDAAADGDTILVRPAHGSYDYGSIVIDEKSLTIIAGEKNLISATNVVGDITVRNLLPSQFVAIIGVARFSSGSLVLENNLGSVWIEQARFTSAPGPFQAPHNPIAIIDDCASVTLIRVVWVAPPYTAVCGPSDPCLSIPGNTGMTVTDSELHLYDCIGIGSDGGPGYDPFNLGNVAGDGGPALRLTNSTLNLFDATLRGGKGGTGGQGLPAPFCADGGDGGAGMLVTDTLSQIRSMDSLNLGGAAGPWTASNPLPNGCQDGAIGLPLDGPGAGLLTNLPGTFRAVEFTGAQTIQEGEQASIELLGEPSDLVFLGVGLVPNPIFDPLFGGTVAFAPLKILNLGSLGAGSTKVIPIVAGDIALPGEAVTIFAQAYFLDAVLDLFVSAPTATSVIDASHDVFDGCTGLVHVDDDAPDDPGPGDPNISDPLEDGTIAHPFDSIQESFSAVNFVNSTVLLADGIYGVPSPSGLDLGFKILTIESENGPQNCIIDATGANSAVVFGYSVLTLDNGIRGVTITGASNRGVICSGTSVTIDNCIIEGNAASNGAGIRLINSSSTISNCIVRNNTASNQGGGLYSTNGLPTILNSTFVNNSATGGGGLTLPQSRTVVQGCTIANNVGGGIDYKTIAINSLPIVLANSVVWGNTGGPQIQFVVGVLEIDYGDIEGGLAGIVSLVSGVVSAGPGLISVDPLFVDDMNGDFHVSPGSPCIDAGDPAFAAAAGEVDIDGDARVQGAAVDLGSDEN